MNRQTSHLALAAALILALVTPAMADIDGYGRVSIGTDFMFRGVSQTMSRPAVEVEFCLDHDSGAYGFLWSSNVDFTEDGDPDDGANIEVDLGAGYARAINDRLLIDVGVIAYFYPGTESGVDYDYIEWLGAIELDETHRLTIGYSDDVFASGEAGIFYAAGSGITLPADLWLGFEVGHYDLDEAYGASYNYAELGIEGGLQRVEWRVSYHTTSSDAEELFYASTVDDRVALTLNLPFE
tara:strand:- start:3401 stop:4117 length:717 start_codon:yes stop_codon:yes gene_type:complete